ncbi:MAG: TIGR02266 family protein [Myxococcales bacterium FL481]|nr:MAG: TIGR02266 family protein [Myxococcales bacterium FL481]
MSPQPPRPSHSSRTSPRIGTVLEVQYRNAGQFLVSYCTNLSRGGLFVSTPTPTPAGKLLTLSLQIPGREEPARLSARVCWTRAEADDYGPAGMGLKFEQLDEVIGAQIDALVAEMKPLKLILIGRAASAWSHMAAMLSSMAYCTPRIVDVGQADAAMLRSADLLIVDITNDPDATVTLLERLAGISDVTVTPAIALCGASAADSLVRASRLASVIRLPADTLELQGRILEALGRVCASR